MNKRPDMRRQNKSSLIYKKRTIIHTSTGGDAEGES
jgi:hypothetical protein